jgi:hypothetical protein
VPVADGAPVRAGTGQRARDRRRAGG